ncbi:putative outer membrane protein [Escherichia coli]|uniref:Putative outer membrane protein n=1 Tax=Escherichia coli TaxID=562 RepID=A0A376W6H5_ECOLX|nr:putative outer membrane protein [Escherichia coli]
MASLMRDTDADVTANYDFRWVLSGSSQQLGTSGGIVNSSFDNNNLVIPATNDEARTNLNGPARDGKEALSHPDQRRRGTGLQTSHYLQTQITRTRQASV